MFFQNFITPFITEFDNLLTYLFLLIKMLKRLKFKYVLFFSKNSDFNNLYFYKDKYFQNT